MAGAAAVAVIGQPQKDRNDDREADGRECEQRAGKAEERQNEQRRHGGTDDRAEPERGRERGERRDAAAAPCLRGEIGLGRGGRCATEPAVDGAQQCEGAEGQRTADPAVKPREQRNAAQQHRDDEAADPHDRQGLAAVVIALLRPVRRERDPQDGGPGVGDGDVEIGNADLAPDRRHDRLQRGIARRGHEHRAIEQQEMGRGQRRSANPARAGDVGCGRSGRTGAARVGRLSERHPPRAPRGAAGRRCW